MNLDAHERAGNLRSFDDPETQLMKIARRLFAADAAADATEVPRLDGSLTRQHIATLLEDLLDLMFPGLFHTHDRQRCSIETTEEALEKVREKLAACIGAATSIDAGRPQSDARQIVLEFLNHLPDIRRTLIDDARATYAGDPAARSICEVVLAYPGFLAIAAHRLAHRLHALHVPLIPRLMSEWAHTLTGIDIHPGATIGNGAFIDHGTGVVVGETAVIGNNVRLYHGVTLGAVSTRHKRPAKRHPTIQDNVTLYAHATVLGGTTVIGRNSVVGASVFLADSLPENSTATGERFNLIKSRELKS